jgi:hypothetical protein
MDKKALAQAKIYDEFTMEEARYYIKFAVAVYGTMESSLPDLTRDMVYSIGVAVSGHRLGSCSEHTGIPVEDLIALDVAYEGDPTQLRHFVALDLARETIVLASRGTYTHGEVSDD